MKVPNGLNATADCLVNGGAEYHIICAEPFFHFRKGEMKLDFKRAFLNCKKRAFKRLLLLFRTLDLRCHRYTYKISQSQIKLVILRNLYLIYQSSSELSI